LTHVLVEQHADREGQRVAPGRCVGVFVLGDAPRVTTPQVVP
jgi:hypothetical protein